MDDALTLNDNDPRVAAARDTGYQLFYYAEAFRE